MEETTKATDVRLSRLTLISSTGLSVGLIDIMSELNIFEDVFSSVMTGNIVINDSHNLINKLPIIGYEYLLITFEKAGSNLQFKKTFRVYKMSDRIRVNEQNETYILHFASEELLISESIFISKTYTNMTISAMIADISTNYLHIDSKKIAEESGTTGLYTLTIPGQHPFYAINFLSTYALSTKYKACAYMFYEDRDGYHFTSLEKLCASQSIQNVTISPRNAGFERDSQKTDLQRAQESAESISFPECCDTLRNTYSGRYGALLITVDPLRRRVNQIQYNGTKQFVETLHLNEFPIFTNSLNRLSRSSTDHPEAFKKVAVSTMGHDQLPYAQGKQSLRPNNIENTIIPRIMYLTGIHSNRISVSIPGTVNLRVGSVISVSLPSSEEQSTGGKRLDSLYSGRYLITALRHKITPKNYACIAELSKDSVVTRIPDGGVQAGLQNMKRH